MRRCISLPLILLSILGCTELLGCTESNGPQPIESHIPSRAFAAPQGIAVTRRWVIVTNSAFQSKAGQRSWGDGFITVIDRSSYKIVRRILTSQPNPGAIATVGDTAYVVNAGTFSLDENGLATVTSAGGIDVLELGSDTPPMKVSANLPLPMSVSDARIGGYGSIAISPEGRWAYLGSGTRGDVFQIDLSTLEATRGPDNPIALFPVSAGQNGLTTVRRLGSQIVVSNFNSDSVCVSNDWSEGLKRRECQTIGVNRELLEGPLDLVDDGTGRALIVMSIANAIYRVDLGARKFSIEHDFAPTGLAANRIVATAAYAYIVNSSSNNLQRVDLTDGSWTLPFSVFPARSNPFDIALSDEPAGLMAWVTLFGADQVALVELNQGSIVKLIGPQADTPLDPSPDPSAASCHHTPLTELVGIENVVSVHYGAGAGIGQAELPETIRGGPHGAGERAGASTGILSLGRGGEIVVDFGENVIIDGPGPDFIVFENPFLVGPYEPFSEPALVSVSRDEPALDRFIEFPCAREQTNGDAATKRWPYPGCAGVRPVLANVANGCVDATSLSTAGGDAFDLSDLHLDRARYVRLVDAGLSSSIAPSGGFDLDAILLLHHAVAPR